MQDSAAIPPMNRISWNAESEHAWMRLARRLAPNCFTP
jgi:hypothetical protein